MDGMGWWSRLSVVDVDSTSLKINVNKFAQNALFSRAINISRPMWRFNKLYGLLTS